MKHKSIIPPSDEIWNLVKETQKNLKDLSLIQKETVKQMKETDARINKMLRKTDERINKMLRETDEQTRKTDERINKMLRETDEQTRKTDERINKMLGDSGNRWGKLGENLVKGGLVKRLRERGIAVERVINNAKSEDSEFDIIAINGKEIVIVEVKATLDPSDVRKFAEDINRFATLWPEFKKKTIYGAMAFLIKVNKQADSLAEKQGFFVISATGDVIIQNKKAFQPKVFS